MADKEQIIIDGVDVSECNFLGEEGICNSDSYFCEGHTYCYFKQLQKEKFENLNNRQMVESAENLIYENSELYKNLKEKEQECEKYKKLAADFKDVNKQLGYKYLTIKDECEELKERASIAEDNFACEVQARLYHQNEWLKFSKECEKLKKQLKTSEKWRINAESLNEKLDIKNTRYRKALEEIEEYVRDNSDFDKSDILTSKTGAYDILDIINKAKGEGNE